MSYFGTSSLEHVNQEIESALAFYNGFIDTLQGVTGDGVYAYNLPLNERSLPVNSFQSLTSVGQRPPGPHIFALVGSSYTGIDFADAEQSFIKNFIHRVHHIDYNIEIFKGKILNSSNNVTLDAFGQPISSIEYENIPSTLTEGSPLLDIQKAFTFIEKCDIERRARVGDYLVKYYVTNKRIQEGRPRGLGDPLGVAPALLGDIMSGFGQITNLFEGGEYEKYYDTQRVDSPISWSSPSVVNYTFPSLSEQYDEYLPLTYATFGWINLYETGVAHMGLIADSGFSSEVGTTHFLAENHADNDVFFFQSERSSLAKTTGSHGYPAECRDFLWWNKVRSGITPTPAETIRDYDYRSSTNGYLYAPTPIVNDLIERGRKLDRLECLIKTSKAQEALALSLTTKYIEFHKGIVAEWYEFANETFDISDTRSIMCGPDGVGHPIGGTFWSSDHLVPIEYTVKRKNKLLRGSDWSSDVLFRRVGSNFEPLGIENYISKVFRLRTDPRNVHASHERSDDAVKHAVLYPGVFVATYCVEAPWDFIDLGSEDVYEIINDSIGQYTPVSKIRLSSFYKSAHPHTSPYTNEIAAEISRELHRRAKLPSSSAKHTLSRGFGPSESFVPELEKLYKQIPKYYRDFRKKWERELARLLAQPTDASILKGPNGDADTSLKVGFLRSFTTSVKPRSTESFQSHINDDIARIARTGYRAKKALYSVDLSVNSFGVPVFTGYRLEDPLSEYSYSIFGYKKTNLYSTNSDYTIDVLFHDDYDGTKGGELFTSVNGASSKYAKTTALCRGLEAIRLPVEDTDLYYYNGVNPNSGVSPFLRPNNFMGIGAYETNQAKGYRTSHFYQDGFNENSFKYELNAFDYRRNNQGKAFDYVKKIIPNPFNVYPSKVSGEFPLVPVDSGFSKTGASTGSGYYFVEEPRTPLISAEAASYSQPKHKYFYYQNYGPSGKGSGSGFYFTKLYQAGSGKTYVVDSSGNGAYEIKTGELLINPYPRVNTNSRFEIYFNSNDYENWHSSESLYADHYYDYEKEKGYVSTLSGALSPTIPLRAFGSVYPFLNRTVLAPEIDHSSSYLNGYVNYSPSANLARYAFAGPNDSKNQWNLHKHYANVNSFGSKSFYTENQQTKDHSGTAFYNIFPNLYNKQVSAHVPVYKDSSSDEPVGENPLTVSSLTKTCLTWIDLASTLESEVHYLNTDCKLWHPYAMDMYVHVNRTNSFTGQLTVAQGQDLYTVDLPGYPKFNVEIYTGENSTGSSNNGINAKEVAPNNFEDFFLIKWDYIYDSFYGYPKPRAEYSSHGIYGGSTSLNSGSSIINKSATRSVMLESVPSVRSDSSDSLYGGATYNSKDDYIILSPVNTENFPRRVNHEVLSEERSLINDQKVKISYQAFHSNPISVKAKLKWGYEMHEQASGERTINPISGGEEDISAKLSAAGYDLSLERFQDYKIVNLNMPKLFGNPISVFHTNSNSGNFGNYRRNFSPDQSDSRNFNVHKRTVDRYEGFGYAGRQKIDGIFYQRKRYQVNPHYRLEFENFEPHFDSNNFGKKSFGDPDASDYHESLKTGCTISIERKYPAINSLRVNNDRILFRYENFDLERLIPINDRYKNMYYPALETPAPVWSQLQPNYQVEASTYKKSYLALSLYWRGTDGVNNTYDGGNWLNPREEPNYIFEPREVVLSSPFDYGNGYLSLAGGVSLF